MRRKAARGHSANSDRSAHGLKRAACAISCTGHFQAQAWTRTVAPADERSAEADELQVAANVEFEPCKQTPAIPLLRPQREAHRATHVFGAGERPAEPATGFDLASACRLSGFLTPLDARIVKAPQRTAFSGPTLIRSLARLTDSDVSEPAQTLSQRLSEWLDWTDAIALSSAIAGGGVSVSTVAGTQSVDTANACESECHRVRSTLVQAIVGDSVLAPVRLNEHRRPAKLAHGPQPNDATDDAVDYALFRQRCLALQQAMETSIGNLRSRLRVMLAARSPSMARLATVDAAMERALGTREQSLLSGVSVALREHFERLRETAHEQSAQAQAEGRSAATQPGAWLEVFRKDMQSVLLAELDLRFQPVEGLLAALRTRSPGPNV